MCRNSLGADVAEVLPALPIATELWTGRALNFSQRDTTRHFFFCTSTGSGAAWCSGAGHPRRCRVRASNGFSSSRLGPPSRPPLAHAMPCHAMPCHAMPCHVMSCHVASCHDFHWGVGAWVVGVTCVAMRDWTSDMLGHVANHRRSIGVKCWFDFSASLVGLVPLGGISRPKVGGTSSGGSSRPCRRRIYRPPIPPRWPLLAQDKWCACVLSTRLGSTSELVIDNFNVLLQVVSLGIFWLSAVVPRGL